MKFTIKNNIAQTIEVGWAKEDRAFTFHTLIHEQAVQIDTENRFLALILPHNTGFNITHSSFVHYEFIQVIPSHDRYSGDDSYMFLLHYDTHTSNSHFEIGSESFDFLTNSGTSGDGDVGDPEDDEPVKND
ncbi:MAG: hypothetical protein ED557_01855 [Balneola sp.]|nr:MAG: hypothetical protein ED557_01855 [Balneola sp.]